MYAASAVALLIVSGLGFLLLSGGKPPLIVIYRELEALHKEIHQRASSMKDIKELKVFAKSVSSESTKIVEELKDSTHPAKAELTEAIDSIKAALGSAQAAAAKAELNAAADKLSTAKKLLHL